MNNFFFFVYQSKNGVNYAEIDSVSKLGEVLQVQLVQVCCFFFFVFVFFLTILL